MYLKDELNLLREQKEIDELNLLTGLESKIKT